MVARDGKTALFVPTEGGMGVVLSFLFFGFGVFFLLSSKVKVVTAPEITQLLLIMPEATNPTRIRNLAIAFAAIALSAALFLGFQNHSHDISLEAQAKQAVPLEVALSNNKPTLTEFYANWCTSCQAMAPDLAQLKQKYADSANFVMLNVDNTKWLPEILRYRVDGIPHFVFFAANGKEIAQVVGEQPASVMDANLQALVADLTLPYAAATGETSRFSTSGISGTTDPRSHGAQVKL